MVKDLSLFILLKHTSSCTAMTNEPKIGPTSFHQLRELTWNLKAFVQGFPTSNHQIRVCTCNRCLMIQWEKILWETSWALSGAGSQTFKRKWSGDHLLLIFFLSACLVILHLFIMMNNRTSFVKWQDTRELFYFIQTNFSVCIHFLCIIPVTGKAR